MTTRAARRARERDLATGRLVRDRPEARRASLQAQPSKLRVAAFVLVAVAILGSGVYVASSVFFGQRDQTSVSGATSMRISMDGFDPGTLHAKPGQTLTLDWWNQDAAMHLTNGVHTLVSDSLNARLELAAQSRKTVSLTAPMTLGDYDFWCDSCCGGKDNPKMHGTLHVAA